MVSGVALQTVFNAPRLPAAMRRLGLPCIGVGGLIMGLAVRELRRADTELDPRKPTTAIVSSGSNARSRNPVYLGLSAIYVDLSLLARATTALFSGFGDEAPGNRMPDQHNVWLRSGRQRIPARMPSSAWTMPVGSAKSVWWSRLYPLPLFVISAILRFVN